MSGARAAGSYLYSEGFRLCIMCSGGKALRKTSLQSAFGDFGHIVQIETPKSNLAFVAYSDNKDAKDAMLEMDGKTVDGQIISVTKAGPKPNYKTERNEAAPTVLMTTQTEREDVNRRTNASWDEKQRSDKGRSGRSSPVKRRSRSGRSGRRSRSRRRCSRKSPSRSRFSKSLSRRAPAKKGVSRSCSRSRSRNPKPCRGRSCSRSRSSPSKRRGRSKSS